MQTKLIKVVQDNEGWFDWATRKIKENPGQATGAAIIALPFLVAELPIAVAGATAIAGGAALYDWWNESPRIEQISALKAELLRDRNNRVLEIDRIYARHPLPKVYPTTVVAAEAFHSHMISDQMADIARFLKAHVLLRKLRITVRSANGAKLDGVVTGAGPDIGITVHANSDLHHELEQYEENPVIVPYDIEPPWIDHFPEVRAAIEHSSKGSVTRTIVKDTDFGLSASIAAQAGINVNWLSKQIFYIQAIYG